MAGTTRAPRRRGKVVGRLTWPFEGGGPFVTLCLDAEGCPLPAGSIESVEVRRRDIAKGYARPHCDRCGAELAPGVRFSRRLMSDELEALSEQVDGIRDRLGRALQQTYPVYEASGLLRMAQNALDEARSHLRHPAPPRRGSVELRVGAYLLRPGEEPEYRPDLAAHLESGQEQGGTIG